MPAASPPAHPHLPHAHHVPGPAEVGRYAAAILVNLAVIALQVGVGLAIGSAALLADAAHNASDVAGLVVAGLAAWLMTRPATRQRTYGFGKAGVLAALGNGLALMVAALWLGLEAARRLAEGVPAPPAPPMMATAAVAVVGNLLSAWLLARGRAQDLNRRAAVLHLLGDAAVSGVVLAAGGAIALGGWPVVDPLATLALVAVLCVSAWRLSRQALAYALDFAPPGIDVEEVRTFLRGLPGVTAVHDLHVWPLSPERAALTAHLVVPGGGGDDLLRTAGEGLRRRFGLEHVTLQVERTDLPDCNPCAPESARLSPVTREVAP
ncbi:MAG: cation diffusion facilitator family transporter [Sphingomonadaceae bacterium]|uniref:cation diffusion facilitator family transporter n=1 Tax=Thermaurantiacus sp. TaxID=2820283 RepID=UPI00298F11AC|nr:cation diffusion facilitator family transporter [Thermaurantiacus sp.]MCS6987077.1 cation diffusion facilitator family transporter [Sphingomonadaceae bacterium]MDW8415585.1 cation diffusion facilitator family transporter [Thermaurantiacus sp.]